MLECVEIETGLRPSASVIWLHGLGADGHDFEPLVPELKLPAALPLRFVFPHAPMRSVTLNNGHLMRAWFDITKIGLHIPTDVPGIDSARHAVQALIMRENGRGIPASRIILAGFSQGGAVALYTGLQYSDKLAGILALSTYLPVGDGFDFTINPANVTTPIFYAHGTEDLVVPLSLAVHTRDILTARGCAVVWHTYPMPHSVGPAEIVHIRTWLMNAFSTSAIADQS